MKNELLGYLGFGSAMGAAAVETPISEKVWLLGLTGNEIAWFVAFFGGLIMILVKSMEARKLQKDIQLAEIKLKKFSGD